MLVKNAAWIQTLEQLLLYRNSSQITYKNESFCNYGDGRTLEETDFGTLMSFFPSPSACKQKIIDMVGNFLPAKSINGQNI